MATVRNATTRRIGLNFSVTEAGGRRPPRIEIPPGESREVPDDALAQVGEKPVVKAWIAEGWLVVNGEVPVAAEPSNEPTLEDVVGLEMAELMVGIGVASVEDLATSDVAALTGLKGVGEARAEKFIAAAQEALASAG